MRKEVEKGGKEKEKEHKEKSKGYMKRERDGQIRAIHRQEGYHSIYI